MHPKDSLLLAIKSGHHKAIARLVHNVNLGEEIENKLTPIQLAYSLKSWECVETIAKNKKTDDKDTARYGDTLILAVFENRLSTVKILLEAGAARHWNIKTTGDRCLHVAVRNNNVPMITLLLSYDFDLTVENQEKKTPIQLACSLKHWECVEIIAKNKKTDNKDTARYGSALLVAVKNNCIGIAKILLEAGAAKDWYFPDDNEGSLHKAVRNNNVSMITLLLSYNFDLKKLNKANQTPIQLADSLKVNCLQDAWTIYYNAELIKILNTLIIFVQGQRQATSTLYGMCDVILNTIIQHLSDQTVERKDMIQSTKNTLSRISANCLIKSYHGLFHHHSSESKEFVNNLTTILNTNTDISDNIQKAAVKFVSENKKSCRTVDLLCKYKLIPTDANDKKTKSVLLTTKIGNKL